MLEVGSISVVYGKHRALSEVAIAVDRGDIVVILGANGAGKTTLLKMIAGTIDCRKGQVIFAGEEVQNRVPDAVAARGIGHVPEGREVFPFLTVDENLKLGAWGRRDADEIARDRETIFAYFPELARKKGDMAGYLSGGQQQMLAVGRAFMGRPKLMILDEPTLGLSPLLTRTIFDVIRRINGEQGVTVLLVEQNAAAALDVARHGFIMEVGRVVMDAPTAELRRSDDIRELYLGQSDAGIRGEKRWKKRKTWR